MEPQLLDHTDITNINTNAQWAMHVKPLVAVMGESAELRHEWIIAKQEVDAKIADLTKAKQLNNVLSIIAAKLPTDQEQFEARKALWFSVDVDQSGTCEIGELNEGIRKFLDVDNVAESLHFDVRPAVEAAFETAAYSGWAV